MKDKEQMDWIAAFGGNERAVINGSNGQRRTLSSAAKRCVAPCGGLVSLDLYPGLTPGAIIISPLAGLLYRAKGGMSKAN